MMTPAVIDRRGHLAQLAVQAVLGSLAFVTLSWVPLAIGGLIFTASAIWWPRGALVLRWWDAVSARWGPPWLDDGRPPRISTAAAGVNFAVLAVIVALGLETPMVWANVLILCGALAAEVVIGACVPCELIVWAARRGWLRFRTPIGATR